MEIDIEMECPRCGKRFSTIVEIEGEREDLD